MTVNLLDFGEMHGLVISLLSANFLVFFALRQTKIVLSETDGIMVGFGVGPVIVMEELPVPNWIR